MPEWPRDIREELRQHLDDEYEALRARGVSHEAAMSALAADVDELVSTRPPALGGLAADLRYALRTFRFNRGFAAVVVLTLALGIGATTAIFSIVDAVLLRPYPYPAVDRIVLLRETMKSGQMISIAWPNFRDWRQQNQVFDRFGIYRMTVLNLTGVGRAERVISSVVSSDVFGVFGLNPILGRAFVPADDAPDAAHVAIISERFWRSHFSGDSSVLGRTVSLDGETYTVAGVMPDAMRFPSRLTDVWLPFGLIVSTLPEARGAHPGLTAVARLKPGVALDRAIADMQAIAARLQRAYPASNTDHGISVQRYQDLVVEDVRPALIALSGAVLIVLLITCVNLANLTLARGDARQRELAIREALGASRWRIVRQLLAESVTLAIAGGAVGSLLAWWAIRAFVAWQPSSVPRLDQVSLDVRVFAFAFVVSVIVGVLFGLTPAIRASAVDLLSALKIAGRSGRGGGGRMRSTLVVAEIAMALVLLVAAGLTLKSLARLMTTELGFDASHVVTMHMSLPDREYRDVERWSAFHREAVQRVAALPGVDGVGLNSAVPLGGMSAESELRYEGQPPRTSSHEEGPTGAFQAVTPGYFRAMGIQLIAGRSFTDRDSADTQPVAIVEQDVARRFFHEADPIGKRIAFESIGGHGPGATPYWREIVGVVAHVRHYGLVKEPPNLQVYAPLAQLPLPLRDRRPTMTLFVRTPLPPDEIVRSVRSAVAEMNPEIPVFGVQTMTQYVGQATEQSRLSASVLALFASLALVLAALGIYGVLSYLVGRRRQEIGIRLALGATRADVLGLVVAHGVKLTAAGLAVGSAAAWATTRLLANLLVGVSPHDPSTFAAIATLLVLVALSASYLPARRATRVDPIDTLRAD